MAGYIIVGTLAAYGMLSLLWTVAGWLLPGGKGCVFVCYGLPDEGILSRYRWLRGTGLLNCPLLAVDAAQKLPYDDIEFCAWEAVLPRLKRERNRGNGTGNGDHSGRGQRRDLSEL